MVGAGDVRVQTERVLQNLDAVLRAGGASLAAVVKTTIYLADLQDFGAVNEVYARYFPDARQREPRSRSPVSAQRDGRDRRDRRRRRLRYVLDRWPQPALVTAPGAQAARADPDVRVGSAYLGVNTAQVRALDALGLDVRVADVVRDPALLAANGTLGWHKFPPKGGYL